MFNFPRYLTSLYYKRCYPCHIIAFQNRTEIVNWAAEWEVGDMRWCSVKNQNLSHTSVLGCLSLLTRSGASCSPMQGQSMNWSSQPCTSHQQHSYQQPHPTPSAPVYLGPCYQATLDMVLIINFTLFSSALKQLKGVIILRQNVLIKCGTKTFSWFFLLLLDLL